jgi:hypothetical protein
MCSTMSFFGRVREIRSRIGYMKGDGCRPPLINFPRREIGLLGNRTGDLVEYKKRG